MLAAYCGLWEKGYVTSRASRRVVSRDYVDGTEMDGHSVYSLVHWKGSLLCPTFRDCPSSWLLRGVCYTQGFYLCCINEHCYIPKTLTES